MATNFPGSQDSFTNPTSSDTLDSPDHAAQHANVNDAVEAIELALLDGAPLHIDDTNERVGIGTTSPDDSLHVVGDVTIEVTDDGSAAQPEVTLHRGSASPADGDYLGQLKFSGRNDNSQTVNYAKITGKISDASDTTEDGLIEIANIKAGSQSIGYRFTSTDLKLINSRGLQVDGDVGIGTTSPSYKLDVEDATAAIVSLNDSGGTVGASTNSRVIFEAGGSTAGEVGFLNTGSGILSLKNDDGAIYLTTSTADGILFRPNATEAMRITSDGDVGINDTSPSYKLDVNGTGRFTGALDADTQINLGSALHLTQADTDGSMRVEGNNGYIDIGPKNSSYSHIYTDRPAFYFNKESLYANSTDHKIWHRGDLRGSATSVALNSTGYGSISHSLGQTPDFAFVGARATLSSGNDNQLSFPITSYNSSSITFRGYEINGANNSNYTSSTIYNATVYVFWMAGFFS